MQTINIHAAKTQLSRLAEQAAAGEEIVIAKAGRPVCRLMPLAQKNPAPPRSDMEGRPEDAPAAQGMIASFAGCWSDLSDDDFAAIEVERTARRHNAFAGRRADDTAID